MTTARAPSFKPVEKFMAWAVKDGSLTLEDAGGNIHLALFESDRDPDTNIAFGASGEEFLAWKTYLVGVLRDSVG